MIVFEKDGGSLNTFPASHKFVLYHLEARSELGNSLQMNETIIKLNYIIFGHGYLQHAGEGWTGRKFLSYHLYFMPEDNGKHM